LKLFTTCMKCLTEGRPSFEPIIADYYDDGIVYPTCSAGHETAQLVQSSKFEILLESGAIALLEGFTFEAVASFSAALERFYEFALRVGCVARGLSPEPYVSMFQEMARQSERQLGAFMLFYAIEFGKAYKPDTKMSEFRNSVIHKGTVPTLEKTNRYAAYVYEAIFPLYRNLRSKHSDHMMAVTMQGVAEKQAKVPKGMHVSTHSTTIFFKGAQTDAPSDFATALDTFKKARQMIAGSIPHMQALHDHLKPPAGLAKSRETDFRDAKFPVSAGLALRPVSYPLRDYRGGAVTLTSVWAAIRSNR
jgi:hypothetical protein